MSAWLLLLSLAAHAGELAGVTVPDTATVGGQALVLNGLGLREKFYIDIYVGGLYLPARTSDPAKATAADVPRRIVLRFVYRSVTRDQLCDSFREGLAQAPRGEGTDAQLEQLCGMLSDVGSGDELVLDYVPGTGTTVTLKGAEKGTIAGDGFGAALAEVFVGPYPATAKLKKGMLGS